MVFIVEKGIRRDGIGLVGTFRIEVEMIGGCFVLTFSRFNDIWS